VITERRDVRMDVAPDTFNVPADFEKVEKLLGAQSSEPARRFARERK
jgi:hypothetical protein